MSMSFAPLPSTNDSEFFQGLFGRLFGTFMASAREKAGLTVEQAAKLTGFGTQRWSAMEAGDWLPETRQQFHLVAAALDIEWSLMVSIVMMCREAWGLS
jgi:transcriptional regulator with XRE-family HTH domain